MTGDDHDWQDQYLPHVPWVRAPKPRRTAWRYLPLAIALAVSIGLGLVWGASWPDMEHLVIHPDCPTPKC